MLTSGGLSSGRLPRFRALPCICHDLSPMRSVMLQEWKDALTGIAADGEEEPNRDAV